MIAKMAEYIEREVVRAEIKSLCDKYNVAYGGHYGGHAEDLAKTIDNLPAADVAPVRHGHWVRVKGIIQCNICGFGLFPDGYFFENGECTHSNEQDYRFNYCPSCGAKMDKE